MPNGILKHWQFAGLADLAERFGGGYSHVTTRANLQIREIEPKNAVTMIEAIQDLGLVLARLRRRQHPQRHRHADRGHRPAGADRHPALCARMAFPHPQRALALRPAAQVQRRLRRRRRDRGAGRHQRHRLPGGRGEGRLRRRARRLVPARARRHHRPQGFRPRHRRHREARRRDQGRRRHRARVHRARRPHQPQQGAAEIRARRHGLREILALVEEKLGRKLDARAGRSVAAAAGVRPRGPYRRACAEAGRA